MTSETKMRAAVLFSICLIYIFVRFWDMSASCLWFDEIFSIHASEHTWSGLISFVAQDLIHPPLFYILLKIWIAAGGETLFWLRLLPVLFSILAVIPFLMICKELKLKLLTAAVAFSFFAVNGALIKYAQEVRMYSLLLFLSLCSIWLFTRFFIKGKSFAALVIVNVLLVYAHYFGWFVVVSEVAAILLLQRIKILQTLLMFGIAFAGFIPWLFAVIHASNSGADVNQNIGWMARPGLSGIFDFVFDAVEPFYFQQSSAETSSILFISIPILLLIGAAKVFYLFDWKSPEDRTAPYLLTIFMAAPILLALTASWILPVSIWGSRHLIIVFAPISILSAVILTSVKIQPLKIALISSAFLLTNSAFLIRLQSPEPEFIWCAWENAAVEIKIKEAKTAEPVKIYVFEDLVAYHFWFALRDAEKFEVNVVKGIEGLNEDTAYFLPRGFDTVKVRNENEIDGERFWTAFRGNGLDRNRPPARNFFERGYKITEQNMIHAEGSQAYIIKMEKEK
ncbi:MAG: hypothetical protein WKF92_00215 [Pyrinomonadaceae bacterium]